MAAQTCHFSHPTPSRSACAPKWCASSPLSYDWVILEQREAATKSFHCWQSVMIYAFILSFFLTFALGGPFQFNLPALFMPASAADFHQFTPGAVDEWAVNIILGRHVQA